MAIFETADKDNSGTLTVEEFQDVMDDIILRYPQVEHYLKKQHIYDFTMLWKDSQGNERKEIDIEGFKLALSQADSQMKTLPATAQVCIISSVIECFLMLTVLAVKYIICSKFYVYHYILYLGCCPTRYISS